MTKPAGAGHDDPVSRDDTTTVQSPKGCHARTQHRRQGQRVHIDRQLNGMVGAGGQVIGKTAVPGIAGHFGFRTDRFEA